MDTPCNIPCPPLTRKLVGSCPGRVIAKTIIKMAQTATLLDMHVLG